MNTKGWSMSQAVFIVKTRRFKSSSWSVVKEAMSFSFCCLLLSVAVAVESGRVEEKVRTIFSVVRYEKLVFLFSFAGRKALFFVPTLNKQIFSYRLYYDEKHFASPVQ